MKQGLSRAEANQKPGQPKTGNDSNVQAQTGAKSAA